MKIHEMSDKEGEAASCCGMSPSFLRPGDFLTEHPGIATCDSRASSCPECGRESADVTLRTEYTNDFMSMPKTFMRFGSCAHEFRVRVGIDFRIKLERKL